MRLILASSSPRRIELLKRFNIEFDVVPSNIIEEGPLLDEDPISYAKRLSFLKADKVASRGKDKVVLGVDTIVELDNIVMGKPRDRDDARGMIEILSGRTHRVISGFTVIYKDKVIIDTAITIVKFRRLKEKDIEEYLDVGDYLDKAGSYAIQEDGAKLIEYIKGCYYNVMGLPIFRIMEVIKSLKIEEEK
ncbi:MAG: Maf family protein [bacterium]